MSRPPIEAGMIAYEYNGFKENNIILDALKSKRFKTVEEPCDALSRKMKQRARLQKKLQLKLESQVKASSQQNTH